MSAYLDPVEFAAACSDNGLSVTWPDVRGPLLVHRAEGGPSVAVVHAVHGLVDWNATCRRVLDVCFRHLVGVSAGVTR